MLDSADCLQWTRANSNTLQFCCRSTRQSKITIKHLCIWATNRTMRFRYAALRQRPAPSRGRASSFPVHSCPLLSGCQKCSRQSLMLRLPAAPECPIFLCMFRALFRRTVFIKSSKAYCLCSFWFSVISYPSDLCFYIPTTKWNFHFSENSRKAQKLPIKNLFLMKSALKENRKIPPPV